MIPYIVINQFNLGPLTLYTWGLFIGLGFSAGYLLLLHLVYPARDNISGGARKKDLAPERMAGLALAIFFGGVLGAKALPIALLPGGFFNNLDLLFSQHSGAMFMGGLVGTIICGVLYVLLVRLDLWRVADLLVLPTLLGIAVGRIGCVLINDHQGAVTNLPWGILWPDDIIRHPVGIYEALLGFGLLAVFWWIIKKKFVATSGCVALGFLAIYSISRFFLEFIRQSQGLLADPRWGALSVSQWLVAIIFIISLTLLIYKKKC